ncbi:MAG: lipid-A-disaccharide synthase N-terminal domain-containing protein [Planctomycetota bacterium]|jgi:lipid-A-disaccharide synthase-like uncharacterized protein
MMNAFFALATDSPATTGWTQQWLDVTEPWEMWWLLLGLLAQVVFFGRWIIQWVAGEVRRESVMPVMFWWCSLLGASMLLVYFVGRREPIGVLGQAIGWTVYSRNLYLIKVRHRPQNADPPGAD